MLTIIGLTLFIQGVQVDFLPAGYQIVEKLSQIYHRWIIIPLGFLFGLVATLAEPAVRIICQNY